MFITIQLYKIIMFYCTIESFLVMSNKDEMNEAIRTLIKVKKYGTSRRYY